ncbi:MAG: hypothetical protein U9R03_02910 [Candidatus Aerophobetes bacterium]|nr:hypothetical protein [Candidatus Aerophobetes bacterium]
MKRFKFIIVFFTFIIGLTVVFPVYANSYLHTRDSGFTLLPISVRATGMGGAFVAVADDGGACYYNPAGLMQINQKEIGGTYNDLYGLGLLSHSFLSFIEPEKGMGAGGINWTHLEANLEPEKWNYDIFSYSYANFFFNPPSIYRKRFISWGINLKYLKQDTAWEDGKGYSLDVSFLSKDKRFSWGANIQDLISEMSWKTGKKEQIPVNIKLGASYIFNPRFLMALDIDASKKDIPKEIHLGSEWWLGHKRNIALRIGAVKVFQRNAELTFSAGAGFYIPLKEMGKLTAVKLDYAFSYNKNLGNTHRFSLSLMFY